MCLAPFRVHRRGVQDADAQGDQGVAVVETPFAPIYRQGRTWQVRAQAGVDKSVPAVLVGME